MSEPATTINKIVILPGNGCFNVERANFYGSLRDALRAKVGDRVQVILQNMPDPDLARRSIWLPHMKSLQVDEQTLVIGHSSGAVATMRFLEEAPMGAAILVGAYTSDLGIDSEIASGYFEGPWLWRAQRGNCRRQIVQFGSTDDPFLPVEEQDEVARELSAKYFRFSDRGHFMTSRVPELVEAALTLIDEPCTTDVAAVTIEMPPSDDVDSSSSSGSSSDESD
jgi:predicted alpha/beta hydrolase family esterase